MSNATMRAEAEALERGAEILAKSAVSAPGPSQGIGHLERALEIMLRKEAERVRYRLQKRGAIFGGSGLQEVTA